MALLLTGNDSLAGLVAHFRFDEGSGIIATNTAGAAHGTLSSTGAAFVPGGISGNALQLDRTFNGHVLVDDVFGFASGDYSVVAWVKTQPADLTPDTIVLGKHQSGSENGYFVFLNTTGPLGQPGKASFFSSPGSSTLTSLTDVNDGAWHQIVVVAQSGQNKVLYVDGAPVEAGTANSPMVANAAPFVVGGVQGFGAPVGLFTGWVDEVQLYDHALSERNVGFLFRHPAGEIRAQQPLKPERLLVAHWSFDEQSGGTVHDGVGGHDGILSLNGASFASGGVVRNALQLDRNQDGFVEVGNFFDFQNIDFTVVVWVKTPPGDTTPDTVVLGKHEAGFPNGYFLALNSVAGGLAGAPGKASFFPGNLGATVTSTSDVNDGNWHQVVVVSRVGEDRGIYVDGAPVEASLPYSATIANLASFIIGGFSLNGQPAGAFTGHIDELQVYQVALSPADIDFLFAHPSNEIRHQLPSPGQHDALLAHWKFDEPGSTIVLDHAGDNDGTLSPSGSSIVAGGIVNTALRLDRAASGFASFGDRFPLSGEDRSIVFWLKTDPGYDLDDSVVLAKHEGGFENGYFTVLNTTAGGAIGQPGKVSFYTGGLDISATSTTSVNDGNWHQVVAVYRVGQNKTIYVDGAPSEDLEPVFPNSGNGAPFLIGGVNSSGQPTGLFSGWVDEVQIYSVALGDGAVDFLFQHPGMSLPPGQQN
ncbi:MAG TPA: LamG domain-containing protein [Verrucomicrobiae bacterium]|nr:LamG domain-containing protein [Verrucomicrobiae bacterium]